MQAADISGNIMPQKCAIASCLNCSDHRERWVVMPHVTELSFHTCHDPWLLPVWTELISRGHAHHKPHVLASSQTVCSNHFPLGHPDPSSPYPSLYLRGYVNDDDNDHNGHDDKFVTTPILKDTRNTDHDYPKLRHSQEREETGDAPWDTAVKCGGQIAGDIHQEAAIKSPGEEGHALSGVEGCIHGGERTREPSGKLCFTRTSCEVAMIHGQKGQGCELPTHRAVTDSLECEALTGNCQAMIGNCEEVSQYDLPVHSSGSSLTLVEVTLCSRENLVMPSHGQAVRGRKRRLSRDTDHMYNIRKSKCVKLTTSTRKSRSKKHVDSDHPYNSTHDTPITETYHLHNSKTSVMDRICSSLGKDTDHPYNTMPTMSAAVDSNVYAPVSKDTDHLYNCTAKVSVADSVCAAVTRDSDHMYNMPRAQICKLPSESSVHPQSVKVADSKGQACCVVADNHVVDKDHRYQHSVRKQRQRADKADSKNSNSTTQSKKPLGHKGNDAGSKNTDQPMKATVTKSENSMVLNEESNRETANGTFYYVTRRGRKVHRGAVKRQKMLGMSRGGHSARQRSSTQEEGVTSPAHSDAESERACEDNRTDVWRMDHMYVHFSPDSRPVPVPLSDINRQGPQSPLTSPCFSVEGYKQEHSYANSEEQCFAACMQCSHLVQQLVSTIQQQCQHIDLLKKQLRAANARVRQHSARRDNKADSGE